MFNGKVANATKWSPTTIVMAAPAEVTAGRVVVIVGGRESNGLTFSIPLPAVYPLKVSSNNRYLIDQNGVPQLIVADGTWSSGVGNFSLAQWESYLATRRSQGFNAIWLFDLCQSYIRCNKELTTVDGIAPFTSGMDYTNYDVSTPNLSYWARVDAFIKAAAVDGIDVIFQTWDTSSLMTMANANGSTKMRGFGRFLGNRYRTFPNIIWAPGNDFQSWTTGFPNGTSSSTTASTNNDLIENFMSAILSADRTHLQTIELGYNISKSSDDSLLSPYVTLGSVYTYYPNYGEAYLQYNAETKPNWLIESYWEGGSYGNLTPRTATNLMLRRQAYWTVLAGGLAGYMYGLNGATSSTNLSTTAVTQLGYWKSFFMSYAWYKLVPDQSHNVVTAGYGTATGAPTGGGLGKGNEQTDTYVTTARASDGKLAIAYVPVSTTLTVDMSQFAGSVTVEWFDPTNDTYQPVGPSQFANIGTQKFATPGKNSTGDPDWVLVLEVPPVLP